MDHAAAFAAYAECDELPSATAWLTCRLSCSMGRRHLTETGSTAGFSGRAGRRGYGSMLTAQTSMSRSNGTPLGSPCGLDERYCPGDDDPLLFFAQRSLYRAAYLLDVMPSVGFHQTARRSTSAAAESAAVTTDGGVSATVSAARAPNSRHPAIARLAQAPAVA